MPCPTTEGCPAALTPGQWIYHRHCPHLLHSLQLVVGHMGLPMWLLRHCSQTTPILVPPPPPREAWASPATHPPSGDHARYSVWQRNPHSTGPGSLLGGPSVGVPPPRGLLHPEGSATQRPRSTGTGASRPHGTHRARLASLAPSNLAARGRGPRPSLATSPQGLGTGPDTAHPHHGRHWRLGRGKPPGSGWSNSKAGQYR